MKAGKIFIVKTIISDLAVGAHSTGAVYVFKCTPTIHVDASIKVPDAVNLPQHATNFTALFCVKAAESKLWPEVKISKYENNCNSPTAILNKVICLNY